MVSLQFELAMFRPYRPLSVLVLPSMRLSSQPIELLDFRLIPSIALFEMTFPIIWLKSLLLILTPSPPALLIVLPDT